MQHMTTKIATIEQDIKKLLEGQGHKP